LHTQRGALPLSVSFVLLPMLIVLLTCPLAVAQERAGGPSADAGKQGDGEESKEPEKDSGSSLSVEVADGGVRLYAVNADAHELFTELAEKTGLQLIVDDTVRRKVTINLVDKAPREALDYLVSAYGFSFAEVEGILIVSEGIPKNPSSYLLSDIDSVTAKYVQAPQAKSLLPVFLQDHVKINPGQNSVVLSAPRSVLDKFTDDIQKFDQPAAQITLDVLVVEFTDTDMDTFAAEIGWANDGLGAFADSLLGLVGFNSVTDLPGDFYVKLEALVSEGKARVRANPHISTVSGQPASIFIGQQRFLSTPVTLSDEDEYQTRNSIDAGVRLEMTPLTGGEGEIIVELSQEISTLSAPDPTTNLPDKSTRSARTIVRVNDGQTIVIGGLQQEETRGHRSKIPVLGDIPIIGQFFRSKRVERVKTDLAIFITPRTLTLTGHRPPEEESAIMEQFGISGAGESRSSEALPAEAEAEQ
jgi:type II secretory pathway component GspD/PulD (secretin)